MTGRDTSARTGSAGRLTGMAAVVTGGGSGIGRAVIARYVDEGASVSVLERDADRARLLTDAYGDRVVVTVGDVREPDAHAAAVSAAVDHYGRLDVYVGNAGIYDFGRRLERMSPEQIIAGFSEIFEVNVLGYLLGARAAIGPLRESRGTMIFTVSSSGTFAGGGGSLYVASKHAVTGLVKQLAHELAPDIRVNGVAPGASRTRLSGVAGLESGGRMLSGENDLLDAIARQLPLGFVSEPEDHAGLYVTLANARDSRFMTGVVIASDGGLGVGPPRAPATPQSSHRPQAPGASGR